MWLSNRVFSQLHHLKFTVWGKHGALRKPRAFCEFCVDYIINFDNIRCKPSRKKSFKELLQIREHQESNKIWTGEGKEWKRTAPHSGVQKRKQELDSSSWCVFTNIVQQWAEEVSALTLLLCQDQAVAYMLVLIKKQKSFQVWLLPPPYPSSFSSACQWSYEECVMNVYVNYNCIPTEHVGSCSSRREFAPPESSSSYVISAFTYSFTCAAAVHKHLPPTPWISILKTCDTTSTCNNSTR